MGKSSIALNKSLSFDAIIYILLKKLIIDILDAEEKKKMKCMFFIMFTYIKCKGSYILPAQCTHNICMNYNSVT